MTPRIAVQLLLLLPALCGSGCATQALWTQKHFYEPAAHPNLRLYLSRQPRDLLVQYDELRTRHDQVQRRAYLLYANTRAVAARRKPKFIKPEMLPGLAVVPLAASAGATNELPGVELYAVATESRDGFTLYSRGQEVSAHLLPVYPDRAHRTQQVLLTPAAVVGDVTLVSALVGFWWWVGTGFWPFTE
jgi:hypothetical protein